MDGVQVNFLDESCSTQDISESYELCKGVLQELTGTMIDVLDIYGGLKSFSEKIGNKQVYVVAAKVQSEISSIIGALSFTSNSEHHGNLDYFGVKDAFRGQGIGSQMYRKLEDFLHAKGQQSITLSAHFQSPCFEIYKKWGFVPLFGRNVGRFVKMTKTLSPILATSKN